MLVNPSSHVNLYIISISNNKWSLSGTMVHQYPGVQQHGCKQVRKSNFNFNFYNKNVMKCVVILVGIKILAYLGEGEFVLISN